MLTSSKAPVKGMPQFQQQWMGATFLFANAENRDLFAADPEQYAPRYGGYCAYAVSEGHTANIDQEAENRGWQAVPELQQGRSEEMGEGLGKQDSEGGQKLAVAT